MDSTTTSMLHNQTQPPPAPEPVPTLRLWCGVCVASHQSTASQALHRVANRYDALLREAGVVDLAFRALEHSNGDTHTTLRGYDTTGWESFTIHSTTNGELDKVWLYFIDKSMKKRRAVRPDIRSDVELERVFYQQKLTHKNFIRPIHFAIN
ncbi:hypothetical protein Hypma_009889 [Hypsizygus marmoreus]|uniref:Uncharacterized protein n=1 Tax=Hypsizygus marmoreus TaxID=39966 RepID=A0A369JM34_HYPMA|nr:hypothetical protein Hypma_009889 [Hypsizygus marmoreus]